MRNRRWVVVDTVVFPLLTLAIAVGTACDSRPRAPALRDSSVYQNRTAGLRFLVPQGWTQVANSALPPGTVPAEFMLVKYQMKTTARGAVLELLCFDDTKSTDLVVHHGQPSHGVSLWQPAVEPVDLHVGGAAGQRLQYQGSAGNGTMHKDVAVFRRGQRVFSFVGLYWDDDRNACEEVRRAIESIVW